MIVLRVCAGFCVVFLLWGLLMAPVLTAFSMLLSALFGVTSDSSECICFDSVVDCFSRGKVSFEDICDVNPKVLDVSGNGLRTVASSSNVTLLEYSKGLEVFIGRRNLLSELSVKCVKNSSLRILDLSENRISNVSLVGFDKLESVDLSFNKLRTVPQMQMTRLKELDLSHNFISLHSDDFQQASKLQRLYLSYNNVQEFFTNGAEVLRELRTLDLSMNPLNYIVYPLNSFQNLRYLNLSHSFIKKLSRETFYCLESLQILDISHNELASLPKGMFQHSRALKHLNLSHNELVKLQFSGNNYTSEKSLQCHIFNTLNTKPKAAPNGSLPSLISLDLSNNRIVGINTETFPAMHSLRTLNLSHNALSYFLESAFQSLEQLRILDISYNGLTSIPEAAFANSKNLVQLDLSHNLLMNLGEGKTFQGLIRLQHLDVSRNFLEELSNGTLDGLRRLQTLDVSWNILSNISDAAFVKLKALRHLNVSFNRLSAIPQRVLRNCDLKVSALGNDGPRVRRSPACAAQDVVAFYSRQERAMYWPTAWLPPLPWAVLLAGSVAGAAVLNARARPSPRPRRLVGGR